MSKNFPVINKKETGIRIREIMDRKCISVKDIQTYLGFATAQAVYHWLDGRSLPSLDNLYALSQMFQMPMDDIICGNRMISSDDEGRDIRLKTYAEKCRLIFAA